jgi:PIN domain nuclease of toxin-antitoxin system
MIYLDTHVVIWLYAGEVERLSRAVRKLLEEEGLLISPASILEIGMLWETGRITIDARTLLGSLEESLNLTTCDLPFAKIAATALQLEWTRDPFDRLIVAQAWARGSKLVTKDRTIRRNYRNALW